MPSDQDVYLFREGTLANVHRMLGCHLVEPGPGAAFAVWAPNASAVSVMGDWNGWNPDANQLSPRSDGSGIWEGTQSSSTPIPAWCSESMRNIRSCGVP